VGDCKNDIEKLAFIEVEFLEQFQFSCLIHYEFIKFKVLFPIIILVRFIHFCPTNSILMFTKNFFAFSCVFSSRYHQQISKTSHHNLDHHSIPLSNPKQTSASVTKDSHCFIKNTL